MLDAVDPELLPVLALRLRALGEPLRLRVMQALSTGEKSVGELAELCAATQPNISRHVDRLEQAGWVCRRRSGARVLVRIADRVGQELCEHVCALIRDQAADTAVRVGVNGKGGLL